MEVPTCICIHYYIILAFIKIGLFMYAFAMCTSSPISLCLPLSTVHANAKHEAQQHSIHVHTSDCSEGWFNNCPLVLRNN